MNFLLSFCLGEKHPNGFRIFTTPMDSIGALKIIYIANIMVAGWVGMTNLFFPKLAESAVFQNTFTYSESYRLLGALWTAIALLSVLGLWYPRQMSLVLLLQVIYKGSWLLFAVLPSIVSKNPYPKGMAVFFVIWVVLLPFVIPWTYLFS